MFSCFSLISVLKIWKLLPAIFSQNFFGDLFISSSQLLMQYLYIIPNLRSGQCGLCTIPVFFFFLYFLLLLVFSLTNTNKVQRIAGMGEGINVFLVFHSLTNVHLIHRDFYHFFLINPFVITRLMTSETFSPYRFAFYFYFH